MSRPCPFPGLPYSEPNRHSRGGSLGKQGLYLLYGFPPEPALDLIGVWNDGIFGNLAHLVCFTLVETFFCDVSMEFHIPAHGLEEEKNRFPRRRDFALWSFSIDRIFAFFYPSLVLFFLFVF